MAHGERIGFRPEWALIDAQGPIAGSIKRIRIQSTENGVPMGLITLDTKFGEIAVRSKANLDVGADIALRVNRYVVFAGKTRVGESALA